MSAKIIYDDSIDVELIKSKKVSVIGFGSQGHAHALNLHDSGVDVTVGLREESNSFERAKKMGLKVENLENATNCLLYTSPSPRDGLLSRMPSSA